MHAAGQWRGPHLLRRIRPIGLISRPGEGRSCRVVPAALKAPAPELAIERAPIDPEARGGLDLVPAEALEALDDRPPLELLERRLARRHGPAPRGALGLGLARARGARE